jgi:Protein of unknown function (DUF2384)
MSKTRSLPRSKTKPAAAGAQPSSGTAGFREASTPFVATLLDPAGVLDVDRVADAFKLTKFQLADILGLSRETLYKSSRAKAPKTQGRMRDMLEIIGLVEDWAGGKLQAMAWYRAQGIPAFGGRTAELLVKDGYASAVRDYIDHLAMGGFA